MATNTATIGLEKKTAKELADKLNNLLAAYQIFYQNTRGFHWNIKGDKFFTLHVKFEELYTDALTKIDEIAERILTLGYTPVHSFSQYVQLSAIKEITNDSNAETTVKHVLEGFKTLIQLEREVSSVSDELGDDGTNDLITTYIREQEKQVWMYNAFLH
ncbi:DNA starvation/stationary phase protection protein [Chitinophaga horti]|uniref:DNA starvation/stationary phase protection protein n=1 Tax=Chitinophaga horti TaxID=2920382 RepID=A0ABY6J0G7_9BACT|nr:Dps family protein [Chitinophaga horti]UYQ93147.1 DNA starvation/stationary phase protection protein [Chitinophaga horti]